MKNWDEDDGTEYCTAKADYADAQAVADQLGITAPRSEFCGGILGQCLRAFLTEYRAGRTPNPDILCNREIKFRAFLDYAVELGADMHRHGPLRAPGNQVDGRPALLKGLDSNKDQSYFLHAVGPRGTGPQPVSAGRNHQDRSPPARRAAGLKTHAKKDSTGSALLASVASAISSSAICRHSRAVSRRRTARQSGEHQGLMYHTLGQRQGLRIGGLASTAKHPGMWRGRISSAMY
jgi:tRNA-specific 2-thiouridylase